MRADLKSPERAIWRNLGVLLRASTLRKVFPLSPMELNLSNNCVLVYVLRHSGVRGCLTSGKIEFDEGA
jgi:hypothetical protein